MNEQTQNIEGNDQSLGEITQNPSVDTVANNNNIAPPPTINSSLQEIEDTSVVSNQHITAPDNTGVYPTPDPDSDMGFISNIGDNSMNNSKIKFDDSDLGVSKKKKILKAVVLAILVLSLAADGALGYFVSKNNKTIKSQEATIASKDEESKKQEANVQQLKDKLTAATATPAAETPAAATPAPTTTTKKKSTSSTSTSTSTSDSQPAASTQEEVVAPPPPPSD